MNLKQTLQRQLDWGLLKIEDVGQDNKIKETIMFMVEECVESLQNVKRKPWKKTESPTNREALLQELCDVYRFLELTLVVAGYTDEELERALSSNLTKISQRVDDGY